MIIGDQNFACNELLLKSIWIKHHTIHLNREFTLSSWSFLQRWLCMRKLWLRLGMQWLQHWQCAPHGDSYQVWMGYACVVHVQRLLQGHFILKLLSSFWRAPGLLRSVELTPEPPCSELFPLELESFVIVYST